jgi:2'-5' RNA ligase
LPFVATGTRVFVAVDLPEANRGLLAAHLRACAAAAPGYRWVEPDSLHLTLRFIGGLDPAGLERVRAELGRVRARAFPIALGGRGGFGPRSAPRVVWLGLAAGLEAAAAVAAEVERACAAAGLEPDARPFQAHVTLGRQRAEGERLPPLPEPPALAPWTASDFVLFESRPARQPRYVPLDRFPLLAASAD